MSVLGAFPILTLLGCFAYLSPIPGSYLASGTQGVQAAGPLVDTANVMYFYFFLSFSFCASGEIV